MYKNILVPTDGTDFSEIAFKHAIELAKVHGARITGITVISELRQHDSIEGHTLDDVQTDFKSLTEDHAKQALDFEVATQRSALVVLRDKGGEPLPAGLELASSDGTMTAQVADDGLAYVRGTEEGPAELASVPGQPPFVCALPALPAEPMADLGVITCL